MHEFRKPVTILMGLGFPSSIRCAERAHAVLVDWPPSQRGQDHEVAMNACRAALQGQADADTARSAFVTFARHAGILSDDPLSVIVAATTAKAGNHGAPT